MCGGFEQERSGRAAAREGCRHKGACLCVCVCAWSTRVVQAGSTREADDSGSATRSEFRADGDRHAAPTTKMQRDASVAPSIQYLLEAIRGVVVTTWSALGLLFHQQASPRASSKWGYLQLQLRPHQTVAHFEVHGSATDLQTSRHEVLDFEVFGSAGPDIRTRGIVILVLQQFLRVARHRMLEICSAFVPCSAAVRRLGYRLRPVLLSCRRSPCLSETRADHLPANRGSTMMQRAWNMAHERDDRRMLSDGQFAPQGSAA